MSAATKVVKPTTAQLRILRFLRDNPDAGIYTARMGFQSWSGIRSDSSTPAPPITQSTIFALEKAGWIKQTRRDFNGSDYRVTETGLAVAGDAPYDDGKKDRLRWRGYEVYTFVRGYPEVKPVAVVSDIRADGDYSVQYQHDYEAGRDHTHRVSPNLLYRTRQAAALHAARIHRDREAEHRRLAEEFEAEATDDEPAWTESEEG